MNDKIIIILGYLIVSEDNILQKRLAKGLEVAKKEKVNIIIVSGLGNGDRVEAEYMALWLKKRGYQGKIIQENKSRNTIENLLFCSRILEKINFKKVIIVTSLFHEKRTRMIAEQILRNEKFYLALSSGGSSELLQKEHKFQKSLEKSIESGAFQKKYHIS